MKINIDFIYPVGSIYMSVNSTNPGTIFGGTWEQLKDKFLLGAGSTYTNGRTGGEATHTLTVSEMPRHKHSYGVIGTGNGPYNYNVSSLPIGVGDYYDTSEIGNNQPHNNMPPYLVVYMWKRIA